MNFKDLKQGYPIYILDRKALSAKTVNITDISLPHVDAKFGGATNLVVDITTDEGQTYVMIAESESAYPDGMVISTCVDHILREITSMRNTSQQALDRVDRERVIVERCDNLLAELDPSQREKQKTEERFAKIERSQQEMKSGMDQLIQMMKKLTD